MGNMSAGCWLGRTCPEPGEDMSIFRVRDMPGLAPSTGHVHSWARGVDIPGTCPVAAGWGGLVPKNGRTCAFSGGVTFLLWTRPRDMSIPGHGAWTWWRYVQWLGPGEGMSPRWRPACPALALRKGHVHSCRLDGVTPRRAAVAAASSPPAVPLRRGADGSNPGWVWSPDGGQLRERVPLPRGRRAWPGRSHDCAAESAVRRQSR